MTEPDPYLPMTHASFSSAEPRKQIPFRKHLDYNSPA